METALRAYTVNNAWAAGEEALKGSLEAGKLADLVVLDRDPFHVPADELKDLRVLATVIGGEIVYSTAPEPRPQSSRTWTSPMPRSTVTRESPGPSDQ